MRLLFSILAFWFMSTGLLAQINPPDFQCVRNDSLFWELPTNPCGAFVSYDIFFSSTLNGPYSLLTSVTNSTIDHFFHGNPLGDTFYYYIVTNANCPGVPQVASDTLNNNPPEPLSITFVTVNGNDVEISWANSNSPEVTSYIIYRTSPIGSLPIDTIDASFNFYTDLNADPNNQSESYFIIPMDFCGNTSIFDLPHFTVFLESIVDPCAQSIQLDWNRYRNWQNGINKHELFISINNGPFMFLDEASSQDSTYIFTNTNDGDSYCFYVQTTEQTTGTVSLSNVRCLNLDIVEPVRTLFLKNASVNDANEVELTWQWNDDAEVNFVEFEERTAGGNFTTLESYILPSSIDPEETRTLNDASPDVALQYYRIKSFDDCDSTKLSNEVAIIHGSGVGQEDQTNLLNWTPFEHSSGILDQYDIYRIVDGVSSFVISVDENTTSFSDAIDISNPDEVTVCYYILAHARVTNPDGIEMNITSQSNTFCVEQLSNILVPNAFVPEGVNKEFKARIVFGETVDYNMQIFDRWGKKIFETTNQDEGWTGRNGFFYYPAGVYTYSIRITQTNGRIVEKKGSVILIR